MAMKERSDSNNFNSLIPATLIELRERGGVQPINSNHEHSTRFNSHRASDQPFAPFPFRHPLFYFFSHAVGAVNSRSHRSNHRSEVGERF